jgi:hypothetical protein
LLRQELRGVCLDQGGELGEQFLLFFGDLVDPPQLRLGDPQLGAGWQLSELAGEARPDAWAFERFGAELRLEMRRDPDEVPAQPVDQPDAFVHQLIAVVA